MVPIVIATGNAHKCRELAGLLRVPGVAWRSLADYPHVKPARETGRSFEANAIKKARSVAKATGYWALADDSGIEVTALDGAPGIRSARYAGRHGHDAANNRKLLRVMHGVPPSRRGARYVCALALCDARNVLALTTGRWRVRVAEAPKGTGGFGYDPIMVVPSLHKTVAQLAAAAKQRLSHRARAARRLRPLLAKSVRHFAKRKKCLTLCASGST